MKNTVVLAIAFAIAVLAAVVYSTLSTSRSRYRVEVCVTFHGQQACRTASASERQAALRTAMDNACAQIASGMTDSNLCQTTPPDKVTWLSGE